MNFGRLPFQFNPAEQQAELRKRFGLSKPCEMHIDFGNLDNMGAGNRETGSASSSPRFQHRVPVFVEGPNAWISEKSQSNNVDSGRKPNVRVVPIEIEGNLKPARHRTFSGPAGVQQNYIHDTKPTKHSIQNMTLPNNRKRVPSGETKSCVHNIPISIEKSENINDSYKKPNLSSSSADKKVTNDFNNVSTITNTNTEEKPLEPDFRSQLKKIGDILEELKSYETGVENFSGVANDKQYRYLDEMLTRLMLRLDDIETMGNVEVRNARKAAVKKVQSCIDLLETKIDLRSKENDVMMTEDNDAESVSNEGQNTFDSLEEINEGKMVETSVSEEVKDIIHSIEENVENCEVSEVEKVDETEGIENSDLRVDLKDNLSCPVDNTSPISKASEVEMEDQKESNEVLPNAGIENLELSHDTESNVSNSLLPVEMDSIQNFELIEPCGSDNKAINETTEMNESCQFETTDIDQAEPENPDIDFVNRNHETCTENSLEHNCDIVMNEDNLESALNNSETVTPKIISNSYIPENASNNEIGVTMTNLIL